MIYSLLGPRWYFAKTQIYVSCSRFLATQKISKFNTRCVICCYSRFVKQWVCSLVALTQPEIFGQWTTLTDNISGPGKNDNNNVYYIHIHVFVFFVFLYEYCCTFKKSKTIKDSNNTHGPILFRPWIKLISCTFTSIDLVHFDWFS